MNRGFKFNGKHSYTDYGLALESKKIGSPAKQKIKETVPFMDGSYDFSTLGSNGQQVFAERPIEIVIGLPTKSKEQLHILYSKVLTWLVDVGEQQLVFDDIANYYFLAEVESAPDFEEMIRFGKLKVTFTAQPFKKCVEYEGDKVWDTFDFNNDILQEAEFNVAGSRTVSVINGGRIVIPTFNASATNMTIVFGGKTYSLVVGDNKIYDIKFPSGVNSITLNGTGTITVLLRKETL